MFYDFIRCRHKLGQQRGLSALNTCLHEQNNPSSHVGRQIHVRDEEKRRLEAQVLQDRADFTSQAKLLSQHFTQSHHRNTALQVSHEALQVKGRDSHGWVLWLSAAHDGWVQWYEVRHIILGSKEVCSTSGHIATMPSLLYHWHVHPVVP